MVNKINNGEHGRAERSERGEMKRGRARRRTNYRWKSIIIGSGEATRDTVGSGSGSSSGEAMRCERQWRWRVVAGRWRPARGIGSHYRLRGPPPAARLRGTLGPISIRSLFPVLFVVITDGLSEEVWSPFTSLDDGTCSLSLSL